MTRKFEGGESSRAVTIRAGFAAIGRGDSPPGHAEASNATGKRGSGIDAGEFCGSATTGGAAAMATAADSSGDAIFMNVLPGSIGLTATALALGGTTSSRFKAGVRAGFVTLVSLAPTPSP
jgi:hypothetical protein